MPLSVVKTLRSGCDKFKDDQTIAPGTCARKRVDRAIKSGFHIEATALLESLIADRLESSIENKTGEIQRVQNLGPLIKNAISHSIISEDFAADFRCWSNNRAKVVHEMVKVSNKNSGNWRERIAFAKELAMQG